MELSPLTPADIDQVMRIERTPGYEAFIGQWDAHEHASQMASPDARYFGFRIGRGLTGFVILQKMREPRIRLRRIAVGQMEAGTGTRLLRAVMDWVFENTAAEALTLDVALGNPRARHVYLREGFGEDGADDIHYLMSIPRERWAQLRGVSARR